MRRLSHSRRSTHLRPTAPTPAIEIRLGEHHFHALLRSGELRLDRGGADRADAIIATDPLTLAGLLWHGADLAEAEAAGAVTLQGDRTAAERFLSLFPLPDPL